jgi:hypothetical protein
MHRRTATKVVGGRALRKNNWSQTRSSSRRGRWGSDGWCDVGQVDGWDDEQLEWTESQARACQLLHVLLHELGHHHDRMTNRSKTRAARGEPYAERYALRYEAGIWDAYLQEFGLE